MKLTSVIIPHHTLSKDSATLPSVIDSLLAQTCAKDLEVIVVCNPPGGDSSVLRSIYENGNSGKVKVLSIAESNVNKARNLGLRSAKGENILFLDDDCVVADVHTVERVNDLLATDPNLNVCGGNVVLPNDAGIWDRAYAKIQQQWIYNAKQPDNTSAVLFGGFLAGRAADLKDIGFTESIAFGGAENGLLAELRRKGKNIRWFEDLSVTHYSHLNFRGFLYRAWKQGLSAGRYGQPPRAPVRYAHVLERPPITSLLFDCVFAWGKSWGGPARWQAGSYFFPLSHFFKSMIHSHSFFRKILELRRLAKVYRSLR